MKSRFCVHAARYRWRRPCGRWRARPTAGSPWSNSRPWTGTTRCSARSRSTRLSRWPICWPSGTAHSASRWIRRCWRGSTSSSAIASVSAMPVFKSAASSTASRTNLPAGSASARDSWSAKLLCAPPGCCNPVAWCAGSTGSSCRTTPPTIAPSRRWSMMRAARCRKPAGRFAPAAMPRRSLSAASAALPSSSRWSGSRRCWSAASASPTRSRAISIAAATSSPRSRRSAPPAATSSRST